MKEKRCKYCIYISSAMGGGIKTCDYILITGHSRTVGMTPEQKKAPCPYYTTGEKTRRVVRLSAPFRKGMW